MMHPAGASPAPRSSRARWLAATAALLMCLGFVALGTWQIYRLQWKLALIERVEQRVHATPAAAPPSAAWAAVSRERDEYRHVFVQGHYLDGADALVQATTELGGGFWLLTPFCTVDGATVLVNRGFVTPARPKPVLQAGAVCQPGGAATTTTTTTVTGLLRLPETGGGYLRNNDATANRWFSRDVAAIATARALGPVAPYFIDREADAGTPPAGTPVGGLTVLDFTNNHVVYALTWYALALLAAGGAWLLLRRGAGSSR
ncbi:SURF1 family protein [Massilia sp. DWR3-1-1]|uniref:SURF1 family protein n=1 Tax=Massilia sp. DWR3-1-1 TaxID=2804559 RepID=UPI003CE84A8D